MSEPQRHESDGAVVNHVGQCVTDLVASQRFYVDLLGFEVERSLTLPDEIVGPFLDVEPPVGMTAVYLRRGSFVLELIHFNRPGNPDAAVRPFNEPGLTHLSISVDDLDSVVGRVADAGGTVLRSSSQAAIVRDPNGQLLELLPMSYHLRLG